MHGDTYEAPAVEDTTPVEAPLNTQPVSDGTERTPVWRRKEESE